MKNLKACILFILILLVVACNNSIKYPDGGYDYPKHVADKDTNFFYYPLTNIKSKYAFAYKYLFYQMFDEPNLSIRPLPKETFRLTYGNAFGKRLIITLTDGLLTVKKGNTHTIDIYKIDTSRLTQIENLHLKILDRLYPLDDTTSKRPYAKRCLDSIIKLYPQLLDANYYHQIYEKQFVSTGNKFTYEHSKIKLLHKQYDSIVNQINLSEFWHLPYFIECHEAIADGDAFTLEANTKYKYQNVSVQICGDDTSKFIMTCQNLIHHANLDNEIDLMWAKHVSNTSDTTKEIIVQDVQLEDIKEPPPKHKKKKAHLPNKDSTVQVSDTTKMP